MADCFPGCIVIVTEYKFFNQNVNYWKDIDVQNTEKTNNIDFYAGNYRFISFLYYIK